MQPRKPSPAGRFRSLPCLVQVILGIVVLIVLGALLSLGNFVWNGFAAGLSRVAAGATATSAAQQVTDTVPIDVPTDTPTPAVQYPPKTQTDLQGLAAQGNVSQVHEFHSENAGLGVCPQPRRDVTVDAKLTGQALAQDLLAYFYAQNLDNPCGSVVFAYHNQGEMGNGYTAGRVKLDVADASGQSNMDPNGTGLTYTLTLDVGDVATGQEYTVSWTK